MNSDCYSALLQYHSYSNSRFSAIASVDLFATFLIDFLATVSIDATVSLLQCSCYSTVVTVHPFFFLFLTCIKIKQKLVTI